MFARAARPRATYHAKRTAKPGKPGAKATVSRDMSVAPAILALGAGLLEAGNADWAVWGMTASVGARLARGHRGGPRWK